ncbi:MAG: FHA domain-containing protein [Deltaproteobacteria bacterium]|nr:FHA domain-containing protein [Deltaproteobacteria bacterium]
MTRIYILNGPDQGKGFDFDKETIYVGRSSDNDIQILDRTVSSKHLRIRREGEKYFLTDLNSQNGTFFNGNFLSPGIEMEVKERVPIMIGMSIICIGTGCREHLSSLIRDIPPDEATLSGERALFAERRSRTYQKRRELVYNVYEILMKEDLNEALEGVIDNIFSSLKKVERAVVAIADPETGTIRKIISKTKRPEHGTTPGYSREVVEKVLKEGKAVVISDTRSASAEENLAETLKLYRIESVMCVPLIGISKILGVLYVDSLSSPYGFRKEDLSLFYDLSRRTAMAIEYGWFTSKL